MRIAIVGAGGFIGPRLTAVLTQRSHELVTISSRDGFFNEDTGMLSELPSVDRLDALVYLAQSPYYRELPRRLSHVWSVNVLSAAKAAEWARQNGATRVIYASTGNVYAPSFQPHTETDPLNRQDWYALSKVHAEETLALVPDVALTCARLFGVYGPEQSHKLVPNLIGSIREGRTIALQPHPLEPEDRDGLRLSLCYIDDVVRVLVRLAEEGGPQVLNVATPEALSVRGIATLLGERLGIEPKFTVAPQARQFDLIADASLVMPILGAFTCAENGLANTIAEIQDRSVPPS